MSDRRRAPAPLVELTRARVLEFVREPEAVFWVFVFPVLLALALGIAFRSQPLDRVRVAVTGPTAGEVAARLAPAPALDVSELEPAAGAEALRKGRVDVLVEAGAGSAVTYRFEPSRPEGLAARLAVDDALQRSFGRVDPVTTTAAPVTEVGARYIDFLIPGLVGLNLMGSGLWGLGFSVVVARTRKLLKRFAATPMRRSHYLASFALSRLLFLIPEIAAIVGFGWLVFGVEVRGSLVALSVVSLLGAAAFAALGLLVAARPTTIEAVSGWMNLVMLPMWILSGSFFSYERFPEAVHPLIRALPLTALNDALRAVMNDGLPLYRTWPELVVLGLWGGLSFVLALRLFRWQ
jgi:ABC-2 type transport system permease protein